MIRARALIAILAWAFATLANSAERVSFLSLDGAGNATAAWVESTTGVFTQPVA